MGDDKAGSAVAASGENSMPAAPGGNHKLKIPDVADEIEVLVAKCNLVELRIGAGLN